MLLMDDYEIKVKENQERNKKFINEFKVYLKKSNLSDKTIKNHISNVELFIDDYLCYYDLVPMEDGVSAIGMFLGDWYIEKCLFASRTSMKETAASIKKFYKCMVEKNYINKEDFDFMSSVIKDEMNEWLERLDRFDNYDDYEEDWY